MYGVGTPIAVPQLLDLGGVFGTVAKIGVGVATGGVSGGVIAAGSTLLGGGAAQRPRLMTVSGRRVEAGLPEFAARRQGTRTVESNIFGTRVRETFAGPGATATPAQVAQAVVSQGCPPGMHPNKSDYFLKDGTFVPKGSRCVRNRRMEVGNSRALRRSIRRETGFAKLAKRALRGSRFKVVSASSGTRRGPRTIVESGPGSVVTR